MPIGGNRCEHMNSNFNLNNNWFACTTASPDPFAAGKSKQYKYFLNSRIHRRINHFVNLICFAFDHNPNRTFETNYRYIYRCDACATGSVSSSPMLYPSTKLSFISIWILNVGAARIQRHTHTCDTLIRDPKINNNNSRVGQFECNEFTINAHCVRLCVVFVPQFAYTVNSPSTDSISSLLSRQGTLTCAYIHDPPDGMNAKV